MYFAEHRFLGDTVNVSDDHQSSSHKEAVTLHLTNGLAVTYGEINGLAGDYFGLGKPISSEPNSERMKVIFRRWFDLLDFPPVGKLKAEAITKELSSMNEKALAVMCSNSENAAAELAAVYKDNPLDITHLEEVSKDSRWAIGSSFMQLLEANVDHFGVEARSTYNAGHAVALEVAAGGDLMTALAVNAFADHFLQDSFAAGHIRVPRKEIADIAKNHPYSIPFLKFEDIAKVINASSNVMHNEDGELGLWLESPSGEKWKAFGDGRLPGKVVSSEATSTNFDQCRKAVQQSIAEVHDAFKHRKVLQSSDFAAWHHAPIMDKVSIHPDNHNPLLKVQDGKLLTRVNGVSSNKYEVIDELTKWAAFWTDNFKQVEDQVRLMVMKFLNK
ncbi:uncharacterized protein BKA55DRAFT_527425 [Fusarium redolens]|uniref:Uncharacterized protein n=1 Tax=Fusarium redolens TaxID=48865 RepID=A0A9P9JQF9_FUSRE|nr:uncharacterized protein BKA55DRAFT_527425 [Fusarium redolens]KAH7224367.1 hypothetical protein BKA55DRAFT_527425 [Fusarium redolens]